MPAPTLTSISPNVGGTVGGAEVTLTGTNFTGATGVTIGGVACTSVVVVSDTSITCVTPAGSRGAASVIVIGGGANTGSNAANSLWIYLTTVPAPLYIYFVDGGVAHITDTWTGAAPQEEGLVNATTGALVGTAGTEVGKPFRNIFPSTKMNPVFAYAQPMVGAAFHFIKDASVQNGYPNADMALSVANVEASKSRLSDEVAGTQPRHYLKVCTWLIFLTAEGNTHKVRKDLVKAWGSKPPID